MRITTSFRILITRFHRIIPTYLLAMILLFIAGQIIPVVGAFLVIPVTIGVAYVMLFEANQQKKRKRFPLLIGFNKDSYLKNIWYLSIRQIIQYFPLIIGLIFDQFFPSYISDFKLDFYFVSIGWNFFIFVIPSTLIALVLSMVPYILADPNFNVQTTNPLLQSVSVLHGNYLKLLSIRLIFFPFIAWATSGIFASFVSVYSNLFGEPLSTTNLFNSWVYSAPIVFILFVPWYQMTHAVLYEQIRNK